MGSELPCRRIKLVKSVSATCYAVNLPGDAEAQLSEGEGWWREICPLLLTRQGSLVARLASSLLDEAGEKRCVRLHNRKMKPYIYGQIL